MGLNEGGGHKTYMKISDGRIAVRCDETDPKAVLCTNKDKTKTWHERRYPSFTGFIRNVWVRTTEWGKDLCLDLHDGKDSFELQMNLDSKYAKGFLICMPNIPLDKQITFTPWMKEVKQDGKSIKKTNLYLSTGPSDEEKIEWFWTKDEPKGLPQMTEIKFKGETKWDDTDRMNYLLDHLTSTFLPKLGKALNEESVKRGHDVAAQVSEDELSEDTPF